MSGGAMKSVSSPASANALSPAPSNETSNASIRLLQRSLQRIDNAVQFRSSPPPVARAPSLLRSSLASNAQRTRDRTSIGLQQTFCENTTLGDVTLARLNDVTLGDLDATACVSTMNATAGSEGASILDRTALPGDMSASVVLVGGDGGGSIAVDDLCRRFVECRRALPLPGQSIELLRQYQRLCELSLDRLTRQLRRRAMPVFQQQQLNQPGMMHAYSLLNQLALERNTWRLLCALLSDELAEEDNETAARGGGTVITDAQTVASLMRCDSETRRAQLVVDWLEHCAADDMVTGFRDKVEFFADSATGWENTLLELQHGGGAGGAMLVSSLDPDAPCRQKRHLHGVDAEDERRLLRYLFALLRAGRLDEAQRLCVRIGQAWRAASLAGWKLHDDLGLKTDTFSEEQSASGLSGNPLRDLWRRAAWQLSSDSDYDPFERAIYGVLCGNVDAVLSVGETWEDRVWAWFRQLVDCRVNDHAASVSTASDSLWSHCGQRKTDRQSSSASSRRVTTAAAVFDEVDALQTKSGADSVDSTSNRRLFNKIQQLAIVGDATGMASTLAAAVDSISKLSQDDHHTSAMWRASSRHLLRTAAHLCLLLQQQSDEQEVHEQCAVVLDHYVTRLIADGQVELCVWHISQLSCVDAQTDKLATLFDTVPAHDQSGNISNTTGVDVSASMLDCSTGAATARNPRRHVISLASRAGLHVAGACRLLVERRLRDFVQKNANLLPPPCATEEKEREVWVGPRGGGGGREQEDEEDTTGLVTAIDWLLFDSGERVEAVRQCNAMCRHLLLTHRMSDAARLMARLPNDSVALIQRQWRPHADDTANNQDSAQTHEADIVREHLCIKALLCGYDAFDDWSQHFHAGRPRQPQLKQGASLTDTIAHEHRERQYEDALTRWNGQHESLTDNACQRLYNVLLFPDGGWMCDRDKCDAQETSSDARARQMAALRATFLPQTVAVLQSVLVASERRQQALQLADIVASDRHAIYRHFSKQHLQSYLRRLRDICVPLLNQARDALGYKLQ